MLGGGERNENENGDGELKHIYYYCSCDAIGDGVLLPVLLL